MAYVRIRRNLFPKMRRGAKCFWMFADYDKYNRAVASLDGRGPVSVPRTLNGWRYSSRNRLRRVASARVHRPIPLVRDGDSTPVPGRWYHAGAARMCAMLEENGYVVLDPDVGTCLRDPIVHFVRP